MIALPYRILLTLTSVATLLAACSPQQQTSQTAAVPVRGVTLQTITSTPVPDILELSGTVRARTSALVAARIPGMVTALHVREGDRVRKGQLLATLDAREHLAQAAGAEASADEAIRGVDEALARRKLADTTFERYKKLYDEQALTRQEFEQKQTERELAHQAVERAEARLRQAREGGRAFKAVAEHARIVAPFSGIIVSRPVNLGASVFPGQPLMTIEDQGSYQLELSVPESHRREITPGMPVTVTLDALNTSIKSRIAEIVPAVDPVTRTLAAKVPLSGHGLASGMFGRGSINLPATSSAILVPSRALFEQGSLTAVWTVGPDAIIKMRLVRTGKTVGTNILVLSGLSVGDRIVVDGMAHLHDGAIIDPGELRQ